MATTPTASDAAATTTPSHRNEVLFQLIPPAFPAGRPHDPSDLLLVSV
jgi:hypothetical protein